MLYAAFAFACIALVAVCVAAYAMLADGSGEAGTANAWLGLMAVLVFVASSFLAIGATVLDLFWRGYQ